ncbi:hypothetical protein [Paraburkholderia hospita]|uniref:hypothetical protein n=1 Tax=Paraburkholderia hospita TaxID=169430 RepID=UPI003ECD1974
MDQFTLFCDLTPMPRHGDDIWFGLQIFGAGTPPLGLAGRVAGLAKEIQGLPGVFPDTPRADPKSKDWTEIERLFTHYLGEVLPWTWDNALNGAAPEIILVFGGVTALPPGALTVLSFKDAMDAASYAASRRGYLRDIYRNSANLTLTDGFDMSFDALRTDHFHLLALTVQATRWPAPIPQAGLKTSFYLKVDRSALEKLQKDNPKAEDNIAALVSLTVDSRSYPAPTLPLPVNGSNLQWTASSADCQIDFGSAGLPLSRVLSAKPVTGFTDPFSSLWLSRELPTGSQSSGPGSAIDCHDWWSRFPAGAARAANVAQLLTEALRLASRTAGSELVDNDSFTLAFLSIVIALRDEVGPGIAPSPSPIPSKPMLAWPYRKAPAVADLLIMLALPDEQNKALPADNMPFLDGRTAWPDFAHPVSTGRDTGRAALLYCLLSTESSAQSGDWTVWYDQLRQASDKLQALLPQLTGTAAQRALSLSTRVAPWTPDERLTILADIRREALRPAVRAGILTTLWKQATTIDASDDPLLRSAKTWAGSLVRDIWASVDLVEFLTKHDPSDLYADTAALDCSMDAAREFPGDPPDMPLRDRIRRAIEAHIQKRFDVASVLKPSMPSRALGVFKHLGEAETDAAGQADDWINDRASVNGTGTPSPLVLQIDTLNDDSDTQAGERDLNQWLLGYSAFLRRVSPSAAMSDWGCGHFGLLKASMWSDDADSTLRDAGGAALVALHAEPASATYGLRQVLLKHDEKPWLTDSGALDTTGNSTRDFPATTWGQNTFTVVADHAAANAQRLPALAFGADYEAVAFAQGRNGALPREIAGSHAESAPFRPELGAALQAALSKHSEIRRISYRRETMANGPRVTWKPGPVEPPDQRPPSDWTPMTASVHLNLAHSAWPPNVTGSRDGAPVCLLLAAGPLLPKPEPVPERWREAVFSLMPPACTFELYDRWVAYDEYAATTPGKRAAWQAWRERIEATTMLIESFSGEVDKAEREAFEAIVHTPAASLDDPAVAAFLMEWKPLRSHSTSGETQWIPLDDRPTDAPVTAPIPPDKAITTLLSERGRAGPSDWTVAVAVDETLTPGAPRFLIDKPKHHLTVKLFAGEIGDLSITSAASEVDVNARFAAAARTTVNGFVLFGKWVMRFEVGTPDVISPQDFYDRCFTRVSETGKIEFFWSRAPQAPGALSDPLSRFQMAIDNVGSVEPQWQIWHSTGRPSFAFPHAQSLFDERGALSDESPDPTSEAWLWDAQGFVERFDSSRIHGQVRDIGVASPVVLLHDDASALPGVPKYVRYQALARQRYAELYSTILFADENRKHFNDVTAAKDMTGGGVTTREIWRRAFRPAANVAEVPTPLIRLVVPLTASYDSPTAASADLLVVLDEELDTSSQLLTYIEAIVEPVYRSASTEAPEAWGLQTGHDPIVSGDADTSTRLAMPCVGPIGHSFDTDSREPLFTAASYLLRMGSEAKAWDFSKLSFRRMLLPEMMTGYYGVPDHERPAAQGRIAVNPDLTLLALPGDRLVAKGQGHMTFQGLQILKDTALTLRVSSIEVALTLKVSVDASSGTQQRTFSFVASGNPPKDVYLDTTWRGIQNYGMEPSDRVRSVDIRMQITRVRDARPELKLPPQWEAAGYVAISIRPPKGPLDRDDTQAPWIREWQRILTWRFDEPTDLEQSQITLDVPPLTKSEHCVAQNEIRVSRYSPAEWAQTLPAANTLTIGDKPVRSAGRIADLRVDWSDTTAAYRLHLIDATTRRPAQLSWQEEPLAPGGEGQGLHHRLLITRVVQTVDGRPSEAYVGMFHRTGTAPDVFEPLPDEVVAQGTKPDASKLRAYILLIQRSKRALPIDAPSAGFWQEAFPGKGETAENTLDARHRIVGISPPIRGGSS